MIVPGYSGVNNIKYVKTVALTAAETEAKIQTTSYRMHPLGERVGPQHPSVWEQPVKSWITAPIADGKRLLHTEERVEYRDQDGNLLNDEQVKALEGKVEFKTRYETRTRVVDAQGNEVLLPPGEQPVQAEQEKPEAVGVAPPHPDVEGEFFADPSTFILVRLTNCV